VRKVANALNIADGEGGIITLHTHAGQWALNFGGGAKVEEAEASRFDEGGKPSSGTGASPHAIAPSLSHNSFHETQLEKSSMDPLGGSVDRT
jgi:hypothetical protein